MQFMLGYENVPKIFIHHPFTNLFPGLLHLRVQNVEYLCVVFVRTCVDGMCGLCSHVTFKLSGIQCVNSGPGRHAQKVIQ